MTARIGLFVVLLASVTSEVGAQPGPGRDLAQTCSNALEGDDRVLCANYYLDAYRRDPTAANGDEHLYNAGVLFEQAASLGAALDAYALLRKHFPRSKLDPKALARTAMIYARTAMYDRAAEALEEYAKKYAGEKDSIQAMSDAIYYRKAIGDHDKAIESTKYFVKMFGVKRPAEAARADFSLLSIYEMRGDHDAVRKHLQSYIRTYGSKGGDDRLVIAYAKQGEALWKESCPVRTIDGVCARIKRTKAPAVCSGASTRIEAVTRDAKTVKDAQTAFAQAAKVFAVRGGYTGGDEAGARYYYARAKLLEADAAAESQLYKVAPSKKEKLQSWLEDEVKARARLSASYEAVLAIKDAATSLSATMRIARLVDTLANAVADSSTIKAECAGAAAMAAPLSERAMLAYEVCLAKSAELGWFDDDVATCERALARHAPGRYPPLREVMGDAHNTAAVTATETLPRLTDP